MTFRYTDVYGDRLEVAPSIHLADGQPAVEFFIPLTAAGPVRAGRVHVPLDRVEELIAGVRDTGREAATRGQAPPPAAVEPSDQPRLFHLQRDHDVSGVSGTGRVANGVLWPDGTVSLRWIGERPSTVHWDRLADAEHVHGHGGATRIVWADEQPTVTRAEILLAAADALDESERLRDLTDDHMHDVNAAANELRRMAGEQQ
ncbi:hypothetical protein ACWHLZ_27930 [Streptomyces chartreusis]|uniref:hypothetical protein n=1 Tax=Streptomyces chartreusis TaxID=1969 RepID=UPI00342FCDA7